MPVTKRKRARPTLPYLLTRIWLPSTLGAAFARAVGRSALWGSDVDCAVTGDARAAMASVIRIAIRFVSIGCLTSSWVTPVRSPAYPFTVQSLTEPFSHLRSEAGKSMTDRFDHDIVSRNRRGSSLRPRAPDMRLRAALVSLGYQHQNPVKEPKTSVAEMLA
jgi:hypothetical protein